MSAQSKWSHMGGISEVFWTTDCRYAFQRVGSFWNLYIDNSFVKDFRSFTDLQMFIWQDRDKSGKKPIQLDF